MDIFQFIQSINKVAIIIFFLTGFSLIYEIYLFIKEDQENKKKPKIPSLTTSGAPHFQKKLTTARREERQPSFKQPNNLAIIVLLVLLIIFGILFIIGAVISKKYKPSQATIPTSILDNRNNTFEGIKIYSLLWEIREKSQLRFARTEEVIIIGIKTNPNIDITKARIRVNSNEWHMTDEIVAFNQQFGVFYREYQIASDDALLKIEAQLYSEKNGWIGE